MFHRGGNRRIESNSLKSSELSVLLRASLQPGEASKCRSTPRMLYQFHQIHLFKNNLSETCFIKFKNTEPYKDLLL